MDATSCIGCGWQVEAGYAGCRRRFDDMLARDFSDPRYFRTHRLMVDTYCLQHPSEFCVSAKSFAAHLAGLCWVLEHNADPAMEPERLRQWLNGHCSLWKPEPPIYRGPITIGDLTMKDDPNEWAQAVRQWAEATWAAYADFHLMARHWIEEAQRG